MLPALEIHPTFRSEKQDGNRRDVNVLMTCFQGASEKNKEYPGNNISSEV
jgi:hypothetical protein